MGLAFLLIFASMDSSIALTNDKSTLQDKSWINSIAKYFNNGGKIMQNLRVMKEFIINDKIPVPHLAQIHEVVMGSGKELIVHEDEFNKELFDLLKVIYEFSVFIK